MVYILTILSLSVCLSVCLCVCLFVSLSVCLTVCLSVCLSLCLSDCLSVSPIYYTVLTEGDEYKPAPPRPAKPKQEPAKSKEEEEEDYLRRRRTDFMSDVSEENDYTKAWQQNQKKGPLGAVYRRKRFEDLKSVQERKNEEKQIDTWWNM